MKFLQDIICKSFLDLDVNSYEKEGEFLKFLKSFVKPGWSQLLGIFAQMHLQRIPKLDSLKLITQRHIEFMRSLLQRQMKQRSKNNDNKNDLINLLIRLKEQQQDRKLDSGMRTSN